MDQAWFTFLLVFAAVIQLQEAENEIEAIPLRDIVLW